MAGLLSRVVNQIPPVVLEQSDYRLQLLKDELDRALVNLIGPQMELHFFSFAPRLLVGNQKELLRLAEQLELEVTLIQVCQINGNPTTQQAFVTKAESTLKEFLQELGKALNSGVAFVL